MIIKSIKIKDFISHQDTDFDFPAGVSLFIGPNGAGKSSIIDAIFYSLSGVQVRGDTVDDLIREGARKAIVTLNFDHNGINYSIERERTRNGSPTAKLKKDGSILAQMQTAVTTEITNILGMDKDAIVNSVFIRQGEITSLIDGIPSVRKKIMAKLLGIEKLETCFTKMKYVIEHFEKEIQEETVKKALIRESMKNKLDLENELKIADQNIKEIENEIESGEATFQEVTKNKQLWEENEKTYQNLEKERIKFNEKTIAKNKEIKVLEDNIKISEEAAEAAKSIEPKIKNIEILENYSNELNGKIDHERDLKVHTDELNRVQKLKTLFNNNKPDHDKYLKIDKENKVNKKNLVELKQVQLEMTEIQTNIKNIEKNAKSLIKEKGEIASKAKPHLTKFDLKVKEKKIKALEDEIENVVQEGNELKNIIGGLKGRVNEIDEYLNILNESDTPECPVCSKKLTPEHKTKVIANFEKEMVTKVGEIKVNNKTLKSLGINERKVRALKTTIVKLNIERYQELQKEEKTLKQELSDLNNELTSKEPLKEHYNKLDREVKNNEDLLEELRISYDKFNSANEGLEDERELKEIQNDINEVKQELEKIESKISNISSQLEVIPEDPQAKLKQLRILNKVYVINKEKAGKIKGFNKELKSLRKDHSGLLNQMKKVQNNLEKINYNEKKHKEIKESYNKLNENLIKLKEKKNIEIELLSKQEEKIKIKEKEIEETQKELAKFEKTRRFIDLLREIRKAFSRDGLQKSIRKIFVPKITNFAKQYLEMFNININDISVNEDLDISVLARTGKISINSISGGEKVAVAIILRLAIAKLLSGQMATVIMDEPTTHLDMDRRRELVEAMKSFKKESYTIPQLIVVSHHEELVEIADTIFEVQIREGISEVTELSI